MTVFRIRLGGLLCATLVAALLTGPALAGDDEEAGEVVYKDHCAVCHTLPNPADLTVEWWREKVAKMAVFAQLDQADAAAVEAYVTAHAGNIDDILKSERAVFEANCGSCHEAGAPPSTDGDFAQLSSYLIDHMIEQTDEEPDDHVVHESAEFLLHRQLVPAGAIGQ